MANTFSGLNADMAKQWVEKVEEQLHKAQERVSSARDQLLKSQERWRIKATAAAQVAVEQAQDALDNAMHMVEETRKELTQAKIEAQIAQLRERFMETEKKLRDKVVEKEEELR